MPARWVVELAQGVTPPSLTEITLEPRTAYMYSISSVQVLEAVRPRKSLRSHLRRVYNSAAAATASAGSEVAEDDLL